MYQRLQLDIDVVTAGQPDYPAVLKEIKDYPESLYVAGDRALLGKRCAAVVGSRKSNQYGRNTARDMARRLGERDIVVVSGMASGIDSCAHAGAMISGKTIAVLGCGIDICYPRSNLSLRNEILKKGLLISEYPPGTEPKKYFFPRRNRIISGISEFTVVVQAGVKSGALITAELAAEQGREVYAVPGNIDSEYCLGSNKLIKDGAVPVISTEGVLEAAGVGKLTEKEAERILASTEKKIYDILLCHGEMSADELCMEMGETPAYVNSILTVMEMKGVVFSALGKIFIANE